MSRFIQISLLAAIASVSFLFQDQEQDKRPAPQDDRVVIPGDDENSIARRDFMRTKLLYTQNIFEGLTTGDFDQIKAGIKEVEAITEGEKWVAIDNEFYRKLTEEFKTTTKRLREAADSGNLDATALRYYQMSTSCIDCHKHIRNAAYEF